MKLSKLVQIENLSSITIYIKEDSVKAEIFYKIGSKPRRKTKYYKFLDIDVETVENINSEWWLKSQNYTRYRNIGDSKTDYYVNIYNVGQ